MRRQEFNALSRLWREPANWILVVILCLATPWISLHASTQCVVFLTFSRCSFPQVRFGHDLQVDSWLLLKLPGSMFPSLYLLVLDVVLSFITVRLVYLTRWLEVGVHRVCFLFYIQLDNTAGNNRELSSKSHAEVHVQRPAMDSSLQRVTQGYMLRNVQPFVCFSMRRELLF